MSKRYCYRQIFRNIRVGCQLLLKNSTTVKVISFNSKTCRLTPILVEQDNKQFIVDLEEIDEVKD